MDVYSGAVEAGTVHLLERLFSFVLGLVNNVGRAAVAVVGVVHEQVDVNYLTEILEDFVKVGGRDVLGQFLDDNLIAVSGRAGINADTAVAEGGFKRSLRACCSRTLDERGVGEILWAGLHVLRRPRTSRSISTSLGRLWPRTPLRRSPRGVRERERECERAGEAERGEIERRGERLREREFGTLERRGWRESVAGMAVAGGGDMLV